MGVDHNERQRRHNADSPGKLPTRHPIACIEKRVIDSEAFARLPASAVVVLLLLARNLAKGRNGHIFLSQEDAERHGVAKKTLYRQFKTLTASGFIYPTSRGGHGKCATYALTWQPLSKDGSGLYRDAFRSCAYLDHETELVAWKKRRGKMSPSMGQKSPQAITLGDKNPPRVGDKNPPLESNTNRHLIAAGDSALDEGWIPGYLVRLAANGQTGRQCFDASAGRTLQ